MENLAYVAAVGQPGPRYSGHSLLVDPRGDVVVEAGDEDGALVRGRRSGSTGRPRPARRTPRWLNRRDDEPWPEPQRYAAPS